MAHDAGHRVFVVRINRTTIHTGRIQAVMTRCSDCLLHGLKDGSTKKDTDIAPALVVVEAIQMMAGSNTRLTTCAGVKIDCERILLARRRQREWNQVAVILRLCRHRVVLVLPREYGDWS